MLSIKLIEYPVDKLDGILPYLSKPVFVVAVLIYPLADTLRVFTMRAISGVSPFSADRNHLHHRFIDIGFGHRKTVISVYIFNLTAIGIAVACSWLNPSVAMVAVILFAAICMIILQLAHKAKQKNIPTPEN